MTRHLTSGQLQLDRGVQDEGQEPYQLNGYVGELGWEIYISADQAAHVFETLDEAGKDLGLKLCGMHVMDSCRIEKAFRHFGHDISPEDHVSGVSGPGSPSSRRRKPSRSTTKDEGAAPGWLGIEILRTICQLSTKPLPTGKAVDARSACCSPFTAGFAGANA